MANKIKPKRSFSASSVPTGLESGELAVNVTDKKLYIGNQTGNGNVLIASMALGDLSGSTSNITEGSNLYYTDARARAGISSTATGLTYTSGTGVLSLASGYSIPTTSSQTNWDSAYTQRLQWDGGSTNLVAATGRTSLGSTTVGGNLFTLTNPSAISFVKINADNTVTAESAATFRTSIGAGTGNGTVTSVGLSLPSFITVSNSPVTTTGTLTGALATQTANTVFAGPTTGAAAAPTFRSLVASDIPTLNQNTTGNAATATNLSGGSGGQIHYQSAANTTAFLANGTAGQLLQSNGSTNAPSWVASPGVPTGALFPFAGSSAPSGYLLCDGSSVSSTNYLALHAVISNTYGGSAYTGASGLFFNLPDLRGRLPMGSGTGVGLNSSGTGAPSGSSQTARTLGQWLGEETHLLTESELASHSHANTVGSSAGQSNSITGAMSANASHSHTLTTYAASTGASGYRLYDRYGDATNTIGTTSVNTDHTHTIAINNASTGGNSRHATIPPVIVTNYIIKT